MYKPLHTNLIFLDLKMAQEFEKLTDFEKIWIETDQDLPDLEKEVPDCQ